MTAIPLRSTKAAILVEQRKPLVIDEILLPKTLSWGQVLVEVLYSGICGSQIGEIDGAKGEDSHLPHLLGHEATGRVLAIGDGVKTTKPGDTVILHWRKGRGIEAEPAIYEWKGRPLNAGWVTTFSRHTVVSENRTTVITTPVDLEGACLLGCAVTTGFGVINNNAKLKIGESIVVVGAGGVGLNVIEGASLVSAYPIIAVDRFDHKLEFARQFGATHTINSSNENFAQVARGILGTTGPEVVVDNTGNTDIIGECYSLARSSGRVILVGVPKKGHSISIYTLPLHFGKVLTGSHGGESDPTEDIPRYLRLVAQGKVKLSELVTHRCTLDTLNDAIEKMRRGEITGRCVLSL